MKEKYLINDICDVGSSKRIYLSEYQDTGIPFYRGKEIIEKNSNKDISNELFISQERYNEIKEKFGVPKVGDILMTAVGTIGVSWYVDESNFYFKDGNLIWFKNFKENIVNSRYLYYIFKSKVFNEEIKNISIGSTQKAITIEQVKKIKLNLPKISIQNRIVKILDHIDNKIKLNNEINNNLHEFIIQQYSKYLEELEVYEELDIKDIFDFETGVEPGSKNYLSDKEKDSIKFYRVGDMNSDCNTFIKENLSNGKLLNENDIVVSFDATIGRIGFGLNGSYSTGMKKISLKDKYKNISDNSIVYAYFNHKETQNIMMENARGTTILHASSSIEFMKFKYNESLLKEYSKMISLSFKKMKNIKKENAYLSQLRDMLLPKLMNGEINLDNIEI